MQGIRRALLTALIALCIFVPTAVVVLKRQDILDWWKLRGYVPPAAISALAQDTSMSDKGKRIFYVNTPALLEKTPFHDKCSQSETIIVLGCYIGGSGIYVLDVTDERLAGVEQVTAAHEMLHAAYDRLSEAEKSELSGELRSFYESSKDKVIKDRIELYEKNQADITNELHSILGTEVMELSPALEAYYAQYFTDRRKVVSYSQTYQAAFTERQERYQQGIKDLNALIAEIKTKNGALEAEGKAITEEQQRLSALRDSNQIEEYNAGVDPYNARIQSYNAQIRAYNALVARAKAKEAEVKQAADEAQQLYRAIDSSISTRDQL